MNAKSISSGVVHKLPSDLKKEILANVAVYEKWEDITPLARNEWICWIEDAKKNETRLKHIGRLLKDLNKGKRRPCCWPGCPHREKLGNKGLIHMIQIEPFQQGQEEALWQVFYSAIRQVCKQHYSTSQLEAWAPDNFDMNIWREKIQTIKPYVARIDSNIVGYADLQADGKIDHFFVHGNFQARGVGRALMEKVLVKGNHHKYLYSEVSFTAQAFFEHFGFSLKKVQEVNMRGVSLKNNLMYRHK